MDKKHAHKIMVDYFEEKSKNAKRESGRLKYNERRKSHLKQLTKSEGY